MGQPVYVCDRSERLFGQDGGESLVDFMTCLDLFISGNRAV
jgi:hypothetical protein